MSFLAAGCIYKLEAGGLSKEDSGKPQLVSSSKGRSRAQYFEMSVPG